MCLKMMRMTKTAIATNNLSHGNFAVAFILYFLGNFSINIAKQLSNSSGEPCSPFVLGVNTKQAIFYFNYRCYGLSIVSFRRE